MSTAPTLRLLAVWLTAIPAHGFTPGCPPRAVPVSATVATPLIGRRQLLGSAAAGSVLLSAWPATAVDEASALSTKLDGAAAALDGAGALIERGQWSELRDTVQLSLNAVVKGGVKARAAAIGGESGDALLAARATLISSLQAVDKVAYAEQSKSFQNSKALFNQEGTAGAEAKRAASTNVAAAKTALAAVVRELSKAPVPPPTGKAAPATGITFLTKPTS